MDAAPRPQRCPYGRGISFLMQTFYMGERESRTGPIQANDAKQ